ncbi:MAG: Trp biosynthesis-associated membrane protein [Micrococcales bacterium]
MESPQKILVRWRLASAMIAALMFAFAGKSMNGMTYYTVTVGSTTVHVDGDIALPGFLSVILFQAASAALALYFKRILSMVLLAINLATSVAVLATAFAIFAGPTPVAVMQAVAKATGISDATDSVVLSDSRFLFIGFEIAGVVFLVAALTLRILQKTERLPRGKHEWTPADSNQDDPISMWDSQR